MSRIIGWIKSNVVIVVLCGLMVASLPVGWFFASRWNRGIRTSVEEQVKKDEQALKARVGYAIKTGLPGVPEVEIPNAVPNEVLTSWFKDQSARIKAQADGVIARAREIGGQDRTPLIDGLFPKPTEDERQIKTIDFAKVIIPKLDPERPSAYEQLLTRINAGGPPDPSQMVQSLQDIIAQRRERAKAERNTEQLTPEEQTELNAELVASRIGEYQRAARSISVYAGLDSLPLGDIPSKLPPTAPEVHRCFLWQFDYWVVEEVLDAIAAANTGPDGKLMSVENSPIKKIVSVKLDTLGGLGASMDSELPEDSGTSEGGLAPLDKSVSITGRTTSRGNQVYDVRRVDLTLIVSASRLPAIIDAMSKDRFLTVIDVDLTKVDPWAELDNGFYYGDESVVKATMVVETIWLRSGTAPLMPSLVRARLGIPLPEGEELEASGNASAPAPSAPKSGRNRSRDDEDMGIKRGAGRDDDGGG